MKVLFLLENSADYPAGGTDISSHHLAELLRRRNVRVVEWAPYQTRRPPFWYTSLFILPFLVMKTLMAARKEKVELIHIQGKYLVPVGVIAARLLKIPVIVTIRDYVVCCPVGLCLFHSVQRHNFFYFLSKEISEFLRIYHSNVSLMSRDIRLTLLIRAWFVSLWLRWWTRKADTVIAVSSYVQSVLNAFGVPSVVIHNCFNILKYRKILGSRRSTGSETNSILFVGKDSYGKGTDLFDAIAKRKEFSAHRFVKLTTDRWTPYENVLRTMWEALATVVPSRWQEPFGRVALESLMMGTPVVATKRGGLPEIIENGKTGVLANPTVSSLTKALRTVILNNRTLRDTLRKTRYSLTKSFSSETVSQHQSLYRDLLGKIGNT